MDNPAISIVLPTFNGQKYINQAVDSCLKQILPDWELIIVDDGSTDGTDAIISSYASLDKRISCIKHDSNKNLPAALNRGFSAAKAPLFTWISDDNIFYPGALKKMKSVLDADGNVDIVYAGMDTIDESGGRTGNWPVRDRKMLGFRGNVIGACFLYRRNVHDAIKGFKEEFFMAEDYCFWLSAADQFSFHRIHETLYGYRMHGASLTTRRKEQLSQCRRMLESKAGSIKNRRLKAGIFTHMAVILREQGFYTESFLYLFKAFSTHPMAVLLHSPKNYFFNPVKR